jgi:hypothetical protein
MASGGAFKSREEHRRAIELEEARKVRTHPRTRAQREQTTRRAISYAHAEENRESEEQEKTPSRMPKQQGFLNLFLGLPQPRSI